MTSKHSHPKQYRALGGFAAAAAVLVFAGAAIAQSKQEPQDKPREAVSEPTTLGDILKQRLGQPAAIPAPALQERVAPAVQERPVLQRQNPNLEQLQQLEIARPPDTQNGDTANVIRFDAVDGDPISGGSALNDQYANSHGVVFGRGATIETCRQTTFIEPSQSVKPAACAYPRAASGQNVVHFDLRGGQTMRIDFSRAIEGLALKINPTGGELDEPFQARMAGFDAGDKQIASTSLDFDWRQDAFTWPTTVSLIAKEGRMTRINVELRRPRNANQSVQFLFDDLTLQYAPDLPSPVIGALSAQQRPPRIANPEIVQSSNDQSLREELRLYPAATRVRVGIDWAAAKQTLVEQEDRGLRAASLGDRRAIDIVALPLLLPSVADAGTLSVAGQRDSYHADFDRDGRGYSIYGTRVLTRINRAKGAKAPAENLQIIELEYGLAATFSLYGASYTITRYCLNDSPAEDPQCYDRDEFGDFAAEMVVVIGAAGERG